MTINELQEQIGAKVSELSELLIKAKGQIPELKNAAGVSINMNVRDCGYMSYFIAKNNAAINLKDYKSEIIADGMKNVGYEWDVRQFEPEVIS